MQEIINEEQLKSILELDYLEMQELVLELFTNVDSSVEKIKNFLEPEDTEQILFISHALRGESANFGFSALAKLFTKLENEISNLDKQEIMLILDQVLEVNTKSKEQFEIGYKK